MSVSSLHPVSHVTCAGGNGDSIYSRLMAAVGRPDMGAQNPDYATNSQRCQREMEIYQVRSPSGSSPTQMFSQSVAAKSASA